MNGTKFFYYTVPTWPIPLCENCIGVKKLSTRLKQVGRETPSRSNNGKTIPTATDDKPAFLEASLLYQFIL